MRLGLALPDDGRVLELQPIPENLMQILDMGGLVPFLKARFQSDMEQTR